MQYNNHVLIYHYYWLVMAACGCDFSLVVDYMTDRSNRDAAEVALDQILGAWKIVGYDKSEKFCWVMYPDQLLKALISPSPAVAAEPELGDIIHDKMRGMLAETQPGHPALAPPKPAPDAMREYRLLADRLRWIYEQRSIDLPLASEVLGKLPEIISGLDALVSAPVPPANPVRGDREAIANVIAEWFPGKQSFREQCADAILSLFKDQIK